jgi:hypothetical protein
MQLADKKWMQRFHRLCGENHPASPAIAQLLVNWGCVFAGEELGTVSRMTAESLSSRLNMPLPAPSDFAFQMVRLRWKVQELPCKNYSEGVNL